MQLAANYAKILIENNVDEVPYEAKEIVHVIKIDVHSTINNSVYRICRPARSLLMQCYLVTVGDDGLTCRVLQVKSVCSSPHTLSAATISTITRKMKSTDSHTFPRPVE